MIFGGAGGDKIIGGDGSDYVDAGSGNELVLDDRGGSDRRRHPVRDEHHLYVRRRRVRRDSHLFVNENTSPGFEDAIILTRLGSTTQFNASDVI